MQASKQFLKDNEILPRISFKDKETHTVTVLKDKLKTIQDMSGQQINGVEYLVKEENDHKTFFTTSNQLIQALSQCNQGDVMNIKMVNKNVAGKITTGYEIEKVSENAQN
jgi:hypothetical protein